MSADLVTERVAALLACPREHEGVRVVTLAEIDRMHGRKAGTARDTFRRVKHRLTEGKHYFRVDRTTVGQTHGGESMVVVTEPGYTLLVKPFNDDVSWAIQERVVDGYYRARDVLRAPEGWRLVKTDDLARVVALVDESQRTLAKAAGMAKPSDAAAILGLRRHDSTPGPKQTQRAGRKMIGWQKAPEVREAAKIGARENPAQALLAGVSYTVLTDRGGSDLAELVAGLVAAAVPAAIEKVLAARAAGGVS